MRKGIMILLCLLTTHAYAHPPMPAKCPDVANIQAGGLSNNLARDTNGKWYAGRTAMFYGTTERWTFVIGDIFANTKAEALQEAYEALVSLKFDSGPSMAPSEKWLCLYSNSEGLPSGALTPPIDEPFHLIK